MKAAPLSVYLMTTGSSHPTNPARVLFESEERQLTGITPWPSREVAAPSQCVIMDEVMNSSNFKGPLDSQSLYNQKLLEHVHWVFSINAGHAGSTFLGDLQNYDNTNDVCSLFELGHSLGDESEPCGILHEDEPAYPLRDTSKPHGCGISGWWKGVVSGQGNAGHQEPTSDELGKGAKSYREAAQLKFTRECAFEVYARRLEECFDEARLHRRPRPSVFMDVSHLFPLTSYGMFAIPPPCSIFWSHMHCRVTFPTLWPWCSLVITFSSD